MLDELLTVQGYHGDTVGDKMKQVERSDFNTIDLAWDAHKVRNRIAHEGSEHDLNAREVRRVIALYPQLLDAKRLGEWGGLFAEDAIFDVFGRTCADAPRSCARSAPCRPPRRAVTAEPA